MSPELLEKLATLVLGGGLFTSLAAVVGKMAEARGEKIKAQQALKSEGRTERDGLIEHLQKMRDHAEEREAAALARVRVLEDERDTDYKEYRDEIARIDGIAHANGKVARARSLRILELKLALRRFDAEHPDAGDKAGD